LDPAAPLGSRGVPELSNGGEGASEARPAQALTPESAPQVWRQALQQLGDITADFAEHFDSLAIPAPNRLVVRFRKNYTSSKDYCEHPDRAARLEQALTQVTGNAVRLEFALLDEPGDAQPAPRKPAPRSRLVERSQHPLVRRAEELFKARVVGIEEPE
jgi:hypothetical protein